MVIELLKFKVASDRPKKFIHKDAEIWTQALATYSEFDRSEVWSDSKEPTEVIMIIRAGTREQWKSIGFEQLEQIEKRFAEDMGNISHELLDSSE